MCLAIYKPARAVIPTEHLFNGYECNSNGCGFAYSEKGKLHIVKGLFSFRDFLRQYKEKEECPMLVHFRWATHGDTNVLNCHPFSILNGQFAMIHNGVLPIHCSIKELSDTGNFAKLVMEPMLKNGLSPSKPAFRFLVEQAIGHANRVAIMASNGNVTIFNEDDGETEDAVDNNGDPVTFTHKEGEKIKEYQEQVWYSNSCYKSLTRRVRKQIGGVQVTHISSHQDEYDGYFDHGTCESDVTNPSGFAGTPKTEINDQIVNRANLDAPISVITGFKDGVKNAEESASVMQSTKGLGKKEKDSVVYDLDKNKLIVLTSAPKKATVGDTTIAVIEKGPIFPAEKELEITFMMKDMNVTREAAITTLGLEIQDAITYVE